MRIENLRIDRFGDLSQVTANGFSNRLSLILTPDDDTRRGVIQFIRWMLFGNCDATAQQYMRTPSSASGSLTVFQDGMRRTIARRDDGTRYGRLAVDGGGHYSRQTNHMVSLLGNVTQNDYDSLFASSAPNTADMARFIDAARLHGLQFESRSVSSPRRAERTQRMDRLRRELDQLGWTHESYETLMKRRCDLQFRIEQLREEQIRRRQDLEARKHNLSQQVASTQRAVEGLQSEMVRHDAEINTRRQQLAENWKIAQDAKERFLRERRNELGDIESRVHHWQGMVTDIRQRLQHLDGEVHCRDIDTEHRESSCMVSDLAERIDQMRRDLGEWDGRNQHASNSSYTAPSLHGPALDELRREVSRICRNLRQRDADERYHLLRDELDKLKHCDQALSAWIEQMEAQRQLVLTELQQAEQHGLAVVDPQRRPYLGDRLDVDGTRIAPTDYAAVSGQVHAQLHSCDASEPIHPDSDSSLRDLEWRRDTKRPQIDEAQHLLDDLVVKLRDTEAQIGRLAATEVEPIQGQITEIDNLLHSAQRRDELQRELTRLQDELGRLGDEFQSSPVVDYASQLLRTLSRDRDRRITVDAARGVWIEDSVGRRREASRAGNHIQSAWMCLRLAIVSALRQQGIEVPLIVDEPFRHLHAADDQALAAVLSDFAQHGNQVLVFSRYPHAASLFGSHPYQLIELGRAYVPSDSQPCVEVVEHVRFRPQSEIDRDAHRSDFPRFAQPAAGDRELSRGTDQVTRYRQPSSIGVPADQPTEYQRREIYDRDPIIPETVRRTRRRSQPDAVVSEVSLHTRIDETNVIDSDVATALSDIGVMDVREFLELDPDTIERELTEWDLPDRPIRPWQDNLSLRCWSPGMTSDDAQLLIECGVSDITVLAECDADELFQRLASHLSTHGSRFGHEFQDYLASRVGTWIRGARGSRSQWRRFRSHQSTYGFSSSTPTAPTSGQPSNRPATSPGNGRRASRSRSRDSRGSRSRSQRKNRRTERAATVRMDRARRSRQPDLRFYLDTDDPIIDAPSIGTRTAEKLHRIGVRTVAEFLRLDPEASARKLKDRRIDADVLRSWQAQSNLACRIPQIRGHDACILVACNLTEPDEIAKMSPEDLWAIVKPFAKTTAGKRIIRGGKAPDLAEIRDWINWAHSARKLRAA